MSYLFKQKLRIDELVHRPAQERHVLVVEPEPYLAGLYRHYLEAHGLCTHHVDRYEEVCGTVYSLVPHVLLLNVECAPAAENILKLVGRLRGSFPALPIVSVAKSLDGEMLRRLMQKGVTSHVDRLHTRPQDVVVVVKTLLA